MESTVTMLLFIPIHRPFFKNIYYKNLSGRCLLLINSIHRTLPLRTYLYTFNVRVSVKTEKNKTSFLTGETVTTTQ